MIILATLLHHYRFMGFWLDFLLTLKWTRNFKVPNVTHPIHLRPNSSDISIFRQVFVYMEYDIELDFEVNTIIDAGANVGLASIYFINKYPNAKIITLEPETNNFNCLSENTKLYTNITNIHAALWNETGTINILDKSSKECAFMVGEPAKRNEETEDVRSMTVSEILNEYQLKTIDVLKIDIEGAEKEVFEGDCENWLPKVKCLIVELHDNMKQGTSKSVFSTICKFNFSFDVKGENLIFINQDLKN